MIKHLFVSIIEDDANPDHVQGTHWNQDHTIDDPAAVRSALGISGVAISGSASDLTTGTLPSARLPAFTGDVTTTTGTVVTTIASGVVTNSKLANMAAFTFKGNNTGSSSVPLDLTASQVLSVLGISPASLGQYGDGSDGSAVMDGVVAVAGYTLASSTYTATREAFFQNLTINVGITVNHHGIPGPNAKGILTNNGHINWDGFPAIGQTAGVAPVIANATLPIGSSGGNGGNSSFGNGVNAVGSAAAPRGFDPTNAIGGVGTFPPTPGLPGDPGGTCHGGGGGGALASGGIGGTITNYLATHGDWHTLQIATTARTVDNAVIITGPTGGGGGAGSSSSVGGGGGSGASWGVLRAFAFAGSGTYTAKGGNGAPGDPGSGGGNQEGGGGGGSGAGGVIVVVTASQSPPVTSASVSTVCAGGSIGIGGAPTGTARLVGSGGLGGSGLVLVFN